MLKILSRYLFLLGLFLISNLSYAQRESYVAITNNVVRQYVETNVEVITNIVTNERETRSNLTERQQQAEEFARQQELRNAQKRLENAQKLEQQREKIIDDLLKPSQSKNRSFQPINAIVLDAGHGGKDPGGVANGIEEKRLVFTLVKKIHTLFRTKNRRLTIYVTRKNDTFIPLEERVSKTTKWSARKNVIFVSIHGNIAYNRRVEGFEIYTLSDRASDPDALATERLENAGFTDEDLENTHSSFSLLADLIRDGTRKQSEWLAKFVYDATLREGGIYGRGLKRANFYVLKFNTVPSILIEVGYMSNALEANKLKDETYQDKLANGIYSGLTEFIEEYNKTEGFTK